ncbi:MAG: hypothetical protein GXP40_03080, partial [Chloroflexi bacterium]|nr:hypothetical protein [Chloroflexota bacterium]
MSKNRSAKQRPGTVGQELKRLATTLQQLVDCLLNKVFALTLNAARARGSMLVLLFLAAVFLINLGVRPWAEWQTYFRDLFTYLLQENSRQAVSQEAQAAFLKLVWKIIAPTLQYLPLLIVPFYLALHVASIYLADIFELEKVETARRFIMQASLGGMYDTIRIGEGEVLEKYRDHPIIQIGGPGYVLVELDSAALFEKPDGRPHVIGPTLKKKTSLEGFERFREAIYLKDHYTESIRVSDRSLDGIRVEARDVRLVFSVWRGDDEQARTPTLERPYPFDKQAIETLVYRRSCSIPRVHGGASKRGPWTNAIKSLIRNKLRGFINKYEL